MSLSGWNVFFLLIVIGLLSFFSSFITLDSHIQKEENDGRNIKLQKRDRKVEKVPTATKDSLSVGYLQYVQDKYQADLKYVQSKYYEVVENLKHIDFDLLLPGDDTPPMETERQVEIPLEKQTTDSQTPHDVAPKETIENDDKMKDAIDKLASEEKAKHQGINNNNLETYDADTEENEQIKKNSPEVDDEMQKAVDNLAAAEKVKKLNSQTDNLQSYADAENFEEEVEKVENVTEMNNEANKKPIKAASKEKKSSPEEKKCVLKFKDKCKINPIVKYWDESTDYYISPLKGVSGMSAAPEDRKYVVFQADPGGWNNIRMALEVVILFAQVTGRILVLPHTAVLYLLHFNKKWKDNKSGMEDYFDFDRLRAGNGLETMPMKEFLGEVAAKGLLKLPLPNNDTELRLKPLYDYLESACYVRPWSPGKLFIGFNLTSLMDDNGLVQPYKQSKVSTTSAATTLTAETQSSAVNSVAEEESIYGVTENDETDDKDDDESEEKGETSVYSSSENDQTEKSRRRKLIAANKPITTNTLNTLTLEQHNSEIKALFGKMNSSSDSALVKDRIAKFAIGRELLPYDYEFHQQRAIYFPGHDENRLLTHFYSFLYFATAKEEHRAKRYIRDRLRYHDQIFCTASIFIEKLILLEQYMTNREQTTTTADSSKNVNSNSNSNSNINSKIKYTTVSNTNHIQDSNIHTILQFSENNYIQSDNKQSESSDPTRLLTENRPAVPGYVAFHIRRGDFQQKHTRLPAETIVEYTNNLVPDRANRIAYIATDEGNRSFFEPFFQQYKAVYFLNDLKNNTNIENINQNYIGMIEQVICANAHTFIGTPLSTFTAYITRMRGYMNRTLTIDLEHTVENNLDSKHTVDKTLDSKHVVENNLDSKQVYLRSGQLYNPVAKNRIPATDINRSGLYSRTYYFMKHHMYQLFTKPHTNFPLWIRDFVEAFYGIDDDLVPEETKILEIMK